MRIIRNNVGIAKEYTTLELPADGWLLSAGQRPQDISSGVISVWSVDCEVGSPTAVGVYIIGTGHRLPTGLAWAMQPRGGVGGARAIASPDWALLGRVITPAAFVWHVFAGPVITVAGEGAGRQGVRS